MKDYDPLKIAVELTMKKDVSEVHLEVRIT